MSAAVVAQALGLDEVSVGNFSGSGDEFAEFFGVSFDEGGWAVGQLNPGVQAPTGLSFSGIGNARTANWTNPAVIDPSIDHWVIKISPDGQGYDNEYPAVGTPQTLAFDSQFVPGGTHPAVIAGVTSADVEVVRSTPAVDFTQPGV